jgi:hypothetical protein
VSKTAIFLGLALALGIFRNYGAGQTPAQNLDNTAQSPSTSAVAGSPPSTRSDRPSDNQDRKWHVKLGPAFIGASYSRLSGPLYYPYGLPPFDGYYRAWLWQPYWAYPLSYPAGYFGRNDGRGEIKLTLEPRTIDPKRAEVYVDNAFAGTADHLKNMWLEPGAYDLAVLSKDGASYRRRIYVLSGRSLKIAAKLDPPNPGEPKESKP